MYHDIPVAWFGQHEVGTAVKDSGMDVPSQEFEI
jgi:hypothetical protein